MARSRGARFQDMQTALVEAESSVSESFAYTDGARRGMQHGKFINMQFAKSGSGH
jgi:hypothetical protein